MGRISEPGPAVLIAGIMYSDAALCEKAISGMIDRYGPVELKSKPFRFDMTTYYTPEMGHDIWKMFICFKSRFEMTGLPAVKHETNSIETKYAIEVDGKTCRRVNIDPGYVTLAKLVLASTKDYSHRIYLAQGIYGETTLRYVRDTFITIDTTYPDYQTPLAIGFFNEARDYLKRSKGTWMRQQG